MKKRKVYHKENKKNYSLKEIIKKKQHEDAIAYLKREVEILSMIEHRNILCLVDCYEDKKSLSFVTE
jgi:hypothetical protein